MKSNGIIRWGQQTWPATAMGAAEFRRTQRNLEPWLDDAISIWERWCSRQEPGIEVTTSGTTGSSRVIRHSRTHTLASIQDTLNHWWLPTGSKACLALPTSFVAGQAMLLRAIEGSWDLTILKPTSTPEWAGHMDTVSLTPHQARGWIDHGSGDCRVLLLGGGPVSAKLVGDILASNRVDELWESYGMSETITHVATRRLMGPDDLRAPFHPLPSVTIGVDDTGCAVIHAPTRGVEQLITNDCIEELPQGGFIWLGRIDDVINSGGVLVHPADVERAFESMMPSWISDWVAHSREDDSLGEAVILKVHGNPPFGTDIHDECIKWKDQLKQLLGPIKAPRVIEWGVIPRSERGKILRRLLN